MVQRSAVMQGNVQTRLTFNINRVQGKTRFTFIYTYIDIWAYFLDF